MSSSTMSHKRRRPRNRNTSHTPTPRTHVAPKKPLGPLPTTAFTALGVPDQMVYALAEMDRLTPFPVQAKSLPDALKGVDLCVKAPTGSGKTLAFSLPVAIRTKRANLPQALILLPTRELASQVADTLTPLAKSQDLRVATVYGGTSINRDIQTLRRGVDVIIATPGRLADLVKRREARLDAVTLVVLDEADRMADMGFLPEVIRLLDATSNDRQTLLFSATLDGDVDQLIRRYQHNPVRHIIDDELSQPSDVRHLFWQAERDVRRKLANDVLQTLAPAIVFTRTKHGADRLTRQLRQDGVAAAAIHGDRSQRQRESALKSFRSGEVTTLVATDVAARGIHVDKVALVVHYDLPACEKDYQHRSGRTGRAGETGVVVSFVDPTQHKDLATIQRSLDLPQGFHEIDAAQLTQDVTPEIIEGLRTKGQANSRPAKSGNRSAQNRHRKPKAQAGSGAKQGGSGRKPNQAGSARQGDNAKRNSSRNRRG